MLQTLRQVLPLITFATALMVAMVSSAQEQRPDYLGTNRDWNAFQFTENGSLVCYMVSRPTDEQGNYTQRGDVWAIVTHRPAEGSRNVVHFIAGYPFEENGSVSVTVDGSDSDIPAGGLGLGAEERNSSARPKEANRSWW